MSVTTALRALAAAHRAVGSPVPDFFRERRPDADDVLREHGLWHPALAELYGRADGLDEVAWYRSYGGPAFLWPHLGFRALDDLLEEREDWLGSPYLDVRSVPLFTNSGSGYVLDLDDGGVRDLSVDRGRRGVVRAPNLEEFILAVVRQFEDGGFVWDVRSQGLQVDMAREQPLMSP